MFVALMFSVLAVLNIAFLSLQSGPLPSLAT